MTAEVSIRVFTGASAGTTSAAVTGIDMISADNATNSTANRQTYPITAGENSYEKWIKAYVDAPPDNGVSLFKLWTDGEVMASTELYVGVTTNGVTPTSGVSTIATHDFTTYTAGAKLAWHNTALTATDDTTDYAVIQLQVAASKSPGNLDSEEISYSYVES